MPKYMYIMAFMMILCMKSTAENLFIVCHTLSEPAAMQRSGRRFSKELYGMFLAVDHRAATVPHLRHRLPA